MKYKMILFDLDGTLLSMNQEEFLKKYFKLLAIHMENNGFDGAKIIDSIQQGTIAMLKNNGLETNEDIFWKTLSAIYNYNIKEKEYIFEKFYIDGFPNLIDTCGCKPIANKLIKYLKQQGYKIVLATNPLFPSIATETRIKWAGLDINDFELVTTYENSKACKPNLIYYKNILNELNVDANDCLMVGNDVDEDMITSQLGMDVYLILDELINKHNLDISIYKQGTLENLLEFIKKSEISK